MTRFDLGLEGAKPVHLEMTETGLQQRETYRTEKQVDLGLEGAKGSIAIEAKLVQPVRA